MQFSRAGFRDLFVTTFLTGGAFLLTLFVIAVVFAFIAPGRFAALQGGHRVIATSPVQALQLIATLFGFFAVAHIIVSAGGAAVVSALRTLFVRAPAEAP